jgi:hypothetical protein
MPRVIQAVRDARDLLLVANRDNPKALGDFGYAVDDSPQGKNQSQIRALNPRPFSRSHARRPERSGGAEGEISPKAGSI